MKKYRTWLAAMLAAAVTASLFGGCGTTKQTEEPEAAVVAVSEDCVKDEAEPDTETPEISETVEDTEKTEDTAEAAEATEAEEETESYSMDGKELVGELFDVVDDETDSNDAISSIPRAEDPFEDDPSVGDLLNLLEGIYSAAPGAAGSSIRLEYAAKELLDYAETYSGNISTVYLTINTNIWMDEKIEYGMTNIRADFAECLAMVKECAETIAEDPSVPTPLAEDYDYNLQYDSYDKDKLEEICYYIGLATEVPED